MTKSIQSNSRGGPKTEEGKKRSSQNCLKTGVYSRELVLSHESAREFEHHYASYVRDLKPQDIVGHALVRDLASIAWKQARLRGIDTQVLDDFQNRPLGPFDTEGTSYLWRREVQEILPTLHLITQQYMIGALLSLDYASTITQDELTSELEQEIAQNYPLLHDLLTLKVPQFTVVPSPSMVTETFNFVSIIGNQASDVESFQKRLTLAIKTLNTTIWCWHHKDEIIKEYDAIKQKRLLQFSERPGSSRTHDDLRRSFAKTMSEYRKHEEWRLERSMLDMGEALID